MKDNEGSMEDEKSITEKNLETGNMQKKKITEIVNKTLWQTNLI